MRILENSLQVYAMRRTEKSAGTPSNASEARTPPSVATHDTRAGAPADAAADPATSAGSTSHEDLQTQVRRALGGDSVETCLPVWITTAVAAVCRLIETRERDAELRARESADASAMVERGWHTHTIADIASGDRAEGGA